MKRSPLDRAIGNIRSSAKTALGRARDMSGKSRDSDLYLYNRLKPEHFESLVDQYGLERVIDYIKTMEGKKIKNDN